MPPGSGSGPGHCEEQSALKLSAQLKAFMGKPRLRVKGNEMEEIKRLDYSNVLPTDPQLWKNALCIPGKWIRLTDSRCSEG